MSHMIAVPDELYAKVAALAEERGETVAHVIATMLSEGLGAAFQEYTDPGSHTLNPQTGRPYITSAELRGIGAGGNPPPSDEDVERWRMDKYGVQQGGHSGRNTN